MLQPDAHDEAPHREGLLEPTDGVARGDCLGAERLVTIEADGRALIGSVCADLPRGNGGEGGRGGGGTRAMEGREGGEEEGHVAMEGRGVIGGGEDEGSSEV